MVVRFWIEIFVVLAVLGAAVALSMGWRTRQWLPAAFGIVGLLLFAAIIGVAIFVIRTEGREVATIELPEGGAIEVQGGDGMQIWSENFHNQAAKARRAALKSLTPAVIDPPKVAPPAKPLEPGAAAAELIPPAKQPEPPAPQRSATQGAAKSDREQPFSLESPARIDRKAMAEYERQYRQYELPTRLRYTGAIGFTLLGLLGTLYAYLKADSLTAGAHRLRLQAASAAGVLAVGAIAFLAATGRLGF